MRRPLIRPTATFSPPGGAKEISFGIRSPRAAVSVAKGHATLPWATVFLPRSGGSLGRFTSAAVTGRSA